MKDAGTTLDQAVRAQLDRLILRRVRVGIGLGVTTVIAFTLSNHLWWGHPPYWSDLYNLGIVVLCVIGFALTRVPVVMRHPAAFTLLTFSLGCIARALVGILHGGVTITALVLLAIPLVSAGMIPWGLPPQLGLVLVAGAAIGINAALVDQGFGAPPGQAAVTIVVGLLTSLLLAVEEQRHRVQTLVENVRRRQAEERLARLNAELEQRVTQRTKELERTAARLAAEAHERQLASQELHNSQQRLQDLIDNTSDIIWSVDRDLNVTVMNAVCRARFRERYGIDIDSDPMARARIDPKLAEEFHAYYQRSFAGEHLQVERSYEERNGSRHYLTSVHPIVENGVITGATVFSKDITGRRQAEELARAHQADLAHVLRVSTMGEMAAGLAHEINQPLGAIANYAQGSVRRLRDGSMGARELLPIVERITHEALRAGEIIRRLRGLLAKEAPTQGHVDLNRLVRESAQFVEGLARDLDITVQLDIDPHLPAVRCNSVQIEQVILNLLLNAVEAVQVAADDERRVTVLTRADGADAVEVVVRDTGPGLPRDDIFAPFYTTKASGLGMGLSISRSIVEAHAGHIEAGSNPHRGSTLRFTLPIAGL